MTSRLLRINSSDRDSAGGATPADFSVSLDTPLPAGRYRLAQVLLPHTAPPIHSYGQALVVSIGASDYSVALDDDYFSPAEYLAGLKAALDSTTSLTWTLALDVNTQVVTFSKSGSATAKIYPVSVSSQSTLAPSLGIYTTKTIYSGGSAMSDGALNLASPLAYSIHINDQSSDLEDTKGGQATFYVPIDVNSFEVINWRWKQETDQYLDLPTTTRRLKIHLTNDRRQKLSTLRNLHSGLRADWSFVLERVETCGCSSH